MEAKREGVLLTGVEIQSEKYSVGMPTALPAWFRPLPFLYESTGVQTQFTNRFDPVPRSRRVFSFHRPERSQVGCRPRHSRNTRNFSPRHSAAASN